MNQCKQSFCRCGGIICFTPIPPMQCASSLNDYRKANTFRNQTAQSLRRTPHIHLMVDTRRRVMQLPSSSLSKRTRSAFMRSSAMWREPRRLRNWLWLMHFDCCRQLPKETRIFEINRQILAVNSKCTYTNTYDEYICYLLRIDFSLSACWGHIDIKWCITNGPRLLETKSISLFWVCRVCI